MKPSARAKIDMLEAQDRGEFGNFLAIYPGPTVHNELDPDGWYTIQNKERDSPYFVPVVRGRDIWKTVQDLVRRGAGLPTIYIRDIPPPDTRRLLQGEIHRLPDYEMDFSTHPTVNLRDALSLHWTGFCRGIMVKNIILGYAGQEAWDDLEAVLEKFPDRVVEFTVFAVPVGVFHRQTVIWEARNY